MLFGSNRDFNLLVKVNRELLKDIVEQEVLYYKLDLYSTESNIYGEALEKVWNTAVKLNCLITRGDQVISVDEFGPDLTREMSFAFLKQDLIDIDLFPQVGDVLSWHEDYFKVSTVRENQFMLGRDKQYNLTSYGQNFGTSVSMVLDCHLTRIEDLGITFNNMPNDL
jgi:hypothetical protein